MVAAGPNPGNTPTAVPRVAPIRAKRRFTGVTAKAKPLHKPEKASKIQAPGLKNGSLGEGNFQKDGKDKEKGEGSQNGDQTHGKPFFSFDQDQPD